MLQYSHFLVFKYDTAQPRPPLPHIGHPHPCDDSSLPNWIPPPQAVSHNAVPTVVDALQDSVALETQALETPAHETTAYDRHKAYDLFTTMIMQGLLRALRWIKQFNF